MMPGRRPATTALAGKEDGVEAEAESEAEEEEVVGETTLDSVEVGVEVALVDVAVGRAVELDGCSGSGASAFSTHMPLWHS